MLSPFIDSRRYPQAYSFVARSRHAIAMFAVAGSIFLASPAIFGKEPRDANWVATWGASPQSAVEAFPGSPPPEAVQFDDQTIRMIARTSKGGEQVRVRLDNTFGQDSLVVGEAHVAVHNFGSDIAPSTDRVLTFGGSSTITIPPGAPAVSDPVDLDVLDLTELAVSIYLPDPTAGTSVHSLGRQTTYISQPGNFTDAPSLPTLTTSEVRFFLSGIDVRAHEETSAIVTLGDSITDGFAATVDANRRWPDHLAERLSDRRQSLNLAVVNEGVDGNRVLHDVIGPNALARFDRDVIAQTNAAFVILLEGINDIGFSALQIPGAMLAEQEVSAEQIIQGYRQLIARAHAKDLKIFGATLLPFEGAVYFTAEGERKRQAVNEFIRESGEFDAFIDFDLVTRDPSHPTRLLPLYDSGDHLHPSDAGYRAMADSISSGLIPRSLLR
jgi:lysophospholipase L1-like esterase